MLLTTTRGTPRVKERERQTNVRLVLAITKALTQQPVQRSQRQIKTIEIKEREAPQSLILILRGVSVHSSPQKDDSAINKASKD